MLKSKPKDLLAMFAVSSCWAQTPGAGGWGGARSSPPSHPQATLVRNAEAGSGQAESELDPQSSESIGLPVPDEGLALGPGQRGQGL